MGAAAFSGSTRLSLLLLGFAKKVDNLVWSGFPVCAFLFLAGVAPDEDNARGGDPIVNFLFALDWLLDCDIEEEVSITSLEGRAVMDGLAVWDAVTSSTSASVFEGAMSTSLLGEEGGH